MADHREFLKAFLQEERLLRAFLFGATGNCLAAEDILQTIASTLWEKWDQYDDTRPFRPWALGMAHIEVLKWRHSLARSREVISPEAMSLLAEVAAEAAPELDARYTFLLECLNVLKGLSRRVLELKYADNLKAAEIAQQIDKRVEAVEMILVRARRELRICVERKIVKAGGRSQ